MQMTIEPFMNVILYGHFPLAVSCPLTNSMALIYDGIQLLAETYKHVNYRPMPLSCGDDSAWDKGYTLVNYMKSVSETWRETWQRMLHKT